VGASGILERKSLIDVNAHLSRSHHIEQLVSEGLKLFSLRHAVEVEAHCPAQAHLTRPRLIDLDRRPVQNLGAAGLPNLNRIGRQGSLNFLLFVTENRQFLKFIILTMMLPFTHDFATPLGEHLGVL
jgi:hypothetical protein